MKTEKEFDSWNKIKKEIEITGNKSKRFPQEGEVWMCCVGKNVGVEQNGGSDNFSRPILIVKKFNNQMFWSVPLSTKQKKFDFYYNFVSPDDENISAIIAQLKLVSIKRFKRKMYNVIHRDLVSIKTKLKEFLV